MNYIRINLFKSLNYINKYVENNNVSWDLIIKHSENYLRNNKFASKFAGIERYYGTVE